VFLPIGPDFVLGPRDFNFKCAYGWIQVSVPGGYGEVDRGGTTGCSGFRFRERGEGEGQSNDNAAL